jgi:hypothetical protein
MRITNSGPESGLLVRKDAVGSAALAAREDVSIS